MNARQLVGAVLAIVAGLTVYLAWPKEKLSPEDEIRALVTRAVKAAEQRSASGVVEVLAPQFRGPGGAGPDEVKQLLVAQFFRAHTIVVMNPTLEVTVSSPTTGHFAGTFLFARDAAVPDASKYELEADLERTDDGWRITSASWSR